MQLNLFDWHLIVAGKGFNSLAILDFDDARKRFAEVLKSLPDHPEASRGMRELVFWENAFTDIEKLDSKSASSFFWRRFNDFSYDISAYYQTLRQNLMLRLESLLKDTPEYYEPPDLCLGYLHLLLGDYTEAEKQLQLLMKRLQGHGLLHFFLAEAIWLQGREEKAGLFYAKALLLSPAEVSSRAVSCNRLFMIIQEYGAALAPIYGYLEGILPLVEIDCASGTMECKIYRVFRQVELARRDGDHTTMVNTRRDLKNMAPELFQVYLDWLENKHFFIRR